LISLVFRCQSGDRVESQAAPVCPGRHLASRRNEDTAMSDWFALSLLVFVLALAGTALFFFTLTRGTLLVRDAVGGPLDAAAHVYPIYSNRRLIKLIDFQPIISAILLFQYKRLVSAITDGLQRTDLRGKQVLITSCAFGNVIPRVVSTAIGAGASRVLIIDIIRNELDHALTKLDGFDGQVQVLEDNAIAMQQPDGCVAANVMFFLLHELPDPQKAVALREAARLLEPGGVLYLAEFHRPTLRVLRALSWTYFKTFEPWGLALWDTHDPVEQLREIGGFSCERRTCFFGNFQVIVATKAGAPLDPSA
jgi:ubiquinone/menaquinone biosynthesis C-methylase UbiE